MVAVSEAFEDNEVVYWDTGLVFLRVLVLAYPSSG